MTPSQSAALSDEPCAWCKIAHENFTACVPGTVTLCASCLVEMLSVFDWDTRRNAAEQLGQAKYTNNSESSAYCDDPECASCNGIGADGHIW